MACIVHEKHEKHEELWSGVRLIFLCFLYPRGGKLFMVGTLTKLGRCARSNSHMQCGAVALHTRGAVIFPLRQFNSRKYNYI